MPIFAGEKDSSYSSYNPANRYTAFLVCSPNLNQTKADCSLQVAVFGNFSTEHY